MSHSEGLGLPEESASFLDLAKKSRSLGRRGDLGMTGKHFFRSLFSVWIFSCDLKSQNPQAEACAN
jgi:hypothetical protein